VIENFFLSQGSKAALAGTEIEAEQKGDPNSWPSRFLAQPDKIVSGKSTMHALISSSILGHILAHDQIPRIHWVIGYR
jgi:hypothetical protein